MTQPLTSFLCAMALVLPAVSVMAKDRDAYHRSSDRSPSGHGPAGKFLPVKTADFRISGFDWNLESANGRTLESGQAPWALQTTQGVNPIFRFEVRGDDTAFVDKGKNLNRSELRTAHAFAFKKDIWVSYAFQVEPGAALQKIWKSYCILGQWHASPDKDDASSPPPVSLYFMPDNTMKVSVRSDASPRQQSVAPASRDYQSGPVNRGEWHYVVQHVVFDWEAHGTGVTQVWLDGRSIANDKGPVGYNDARGPYFKFGIYKEKAPETVAVRYANMEIGFGSLAARINNPRGISGR